MSRQQDASEFHVWQRRADEEEERARASLGEGDFALACPQARAAADHALRGMMHGVWAIVTREHPDVWQPAFAAALEAVGARRFHNQLVRMLHGECTKNHPVPHDAVDIGEILADLAQVRVFVAAFWHTFTGEIEDRRSDRAPNTTP